NQNSRSVGLVLEGGLTNGSFELSRARDPPRRGFRISARDSAETSPCLRPVPEIQQVPVAHASHLGTQASSLLQLHPAMPPPEPRSAPERRPGRLKRPARRRRWPRGA